MTEDYNNVQEMVTLFCYNTNATKIFKNPIEYSRIEHIISYITL